LAYVASRPPRALPIASRDAPLISKRVPPSPARAARWPRAKRGVGRRRRRHELR